MGRLLVSPLPSFLLQPEPRSTGSYRSPPLTSQPSKPPKHRAFLRLVITRRMSQSAQPNGALHGAPAQPSTKGSAAAPKLNSEDLEMGHLTTGETPPEPDIMQLARVGDVPTMQKLFETRDLDATYVDNEGITPLHVSSTPPQLPSRGCPTVCLSQSAFCLTWRSSVGCHQ